VNAPWSPRIACSTSCRCIGVLVRRDPSGRVTTHECGESPDSPETDAYESSRLERLTCTPTHPSGRATGKELAVGADGASRILVVDIATGIGRFATGPDVDAACPEWGPGGERLAFRINLPNDRSAIAVLDRGATTPRIVTTTPLAVDGPDTWSPDGRWIYFSGEEAAWRVDVERMTSVLLRRNAVAPTVSPDGALVSYTVLGDDFHLRLANADGSNAHLLLATARNNGWTADGRFVIARWIPPGGGGGVVRVTPDGTVELIAAMADSCPVPDLACDMGWGMAKP
jgi:hypothetical protein